MRRWQQDYPRTFREWRKHYLQHVRGNVELRSEAGRDPCDIGCVCDAQKGRFRKKRAFDCGTTRCFLCHGDKYPRRERTRRERFGELKLREGLEKATGQEEF